MMPHPPATARQPRSSRRVLVVAGIAAAAAFLGFLGLGIWQIERRAWKHALIAQVEARVRADPVAAPMQADWAAVNAEADSYRHVSAAGRYLPGRDTLVQAVTVLGGGSWVMTPLRRGDGTIVLVNRGFVPAGPAASTGRRPPPQGEAAVTGLLRITEPGGGFLRSNDPGADRWYSRDVAAIAAARGLSVVAPYFIDADASPGGQPPVGGLTVVAFSDNHLVYVLTWFVLAMMVAGGYGYMLHDARRH